MDELIERLEKAALELDGLANQNRGFNQEIARLKGKAEGVRLAMSYVKEMQVMATIEDNRGHPERRRSRPPRRVK